MTKESTAAPVVRATDERGIVLSAPLSYAALLGTMQCLNLARDVRGEAVPLRARLWPYMDEAGFATPQEARVPCDVLRAVTQCLRKWCTATGTTLWGDADDAELVAAWRNGMHSV